MKNPQKTLVTTKTGEPYQPVRIYYQVTKPKTVLSALKKLRCMEFDAEQQRWNWLYTDEARKLRFERSYNIIFRQAGAIILGYFTWRGEDQLLLDLRSFRRAQYALDFFSKRINRWAAHPTHLRLVNQLFSVDEMPKQQIHPTLNIFFDRPDIPPSNASQIEAGIQEIETHYGDDEATRETAIATLITEITKQPHPNVEEIPIDLTKSGSLMQIELMLNLRQREAFEHWRGNDDFTTEDAISQIVTDFLSGVDLEAMFAALSEKKQEELAAIAHETDASEAVINVDAVDVPDEASQEIFPPTASPTHDAPTDLSGCMDSQD